MSETKPPFGFKTFLDYKMNIITSPDWDKAANAELAQLRAQAAAYQEAMRRIVSWSTFDPGKSMGRFINAEIEAGRFVP